MGNGVGHHLTTSGSQSFRLHCDLSSKPAMEPWAVASVESADRRRAMELWAAPSVESADRRRAMEPWAAASAESYRRAGDTGLLSTNPSEYCLRAYSFSFLSPVLSLI